MAGINQSHVISDGTESPLRALHSLREAQVATITAGLKSLPGGWSIERHESCDGQLSLMLIHDMRDMTILVDRDSSGILVSVMHGDELQAGTRHHSSDIEAIDIIRGIAGDDQQDDTRHTALARCWSNARGEHSYTSSNLTTAYWHE